MKPESENLNTKKMLFYCKNATGRMYLRIESIEPKPARTIRGDSNSKKTSYQSLETPSTTTHCTLPLHSSTQTKQDQHATLD